MYYTRAMTQSSTETSVLRIGSRGSPLALVQAREVQGRLAQACGLDPARIGITIIRTSGDMIQDRPLADAGGKGLFTKEIEEALLAGAIDLAVHSSKDMPAALPPGLVLSAFLPREDARDAFISSQGKNLARSAQRRGRRYLVATAASLDQAAAARPRHRAAARQCRDAAAQDRSRRGRCHHTCSRGIKASRPSCGGDRDARHRRVSAGSRTGRNRHRDSSRRHKDERAGRRGSAMQTRRRRWPPSAPSSPCSTARAARRSPVMRA